MRFSARFGAWDCTEVEDGRFRLDGGAMFGVVPKVLWQKLIPPDERNRIPLALRCLVLEGHGRVALVDTGIGDKWSTKELGIYAIEHGEQDLRRELDAIGLRPEDVTDVLCTHLHFDHAGGNTWRGTDGKVRPTFPKARYWVSEANLAHAGRDEEKDHVSYLPDNWQPLVDAGLLRTFARGAEVLPGVFAEPFEGHTPGMAVFRVAGDPTQGSLAYCADLVPTAAHVRVNYNMGYDLCARTLVDEKRVLLARAVREGWTLFFEHDPHGAAARVTDDGKGDYRVLARLPDPEAGPGKPVAEAGRVS